MESAASSRNEGIMPETPFHYDLDSDNMTPLHFAANLGNVKVIELLVKHGADVNAVDGYNTTPLHYAEMSGNVRAIEFLVKFVPENLGEIIEMPQGLIAPAEEVLHLQGEGSASAPVDGQ